jgi:hypothetical protein
MSVNNLSCDMLLPKDDEIREFIHEHISYCFTSNTDSGEVDDMVIAIRDFIRIYIKKNENNEKSIVDKV